MERVKEQVKWAVTLSQITLPNSSDLQLSFSEVDLLLQIQFSSMSSSNCFPDPREVLVSTTSCRRELHRWTTSYPHAQWNTIFLRLLWMCHSGSLNFYIRWDNELMVFSSASCDFYTPCSLEIPSVHGHPWCKCCPTVPAFPSSPSQDLLQAGDGG